MGELARLSTLHGSKDCLVQGGSFVVHVDVYGPFSGGIAAATSCDSSIGFARYY